MLELLMKPLFLILFLMFTACGPSIEVTVWEGPPTSEAESAYRDALDTMEAGHFIESTRLFNQLRLKYPYSSKWTTLAELRLADSLFYQRRYTTAAESYRQFVKAHPTHVELPYAYYQVALCYYEQMPSDFFILPDPWQRDLGSTQQAEAALVRFINKYRDSKHVDDAREKLIEVRQRLAGHELYVAEFHLEREHAHGAMNRLLELVERYPDTDVHDDGLFLLAHSFLLQNDVEHGAAALARLLVDHPESEYAEDARDWLTENNLLEAPPLDISPKAQQR